MFKLTCLTAALAFLLTACGTKGPLTLPPKSDPAAKTSSSSVKPVTPAPPTTEARP
jgi:predicted small lipoprotein YifL